MTTANGRPTFAEIDLGALRANYRALSAYTNGAAIMAVVKADAYGHGAVEVARTLRQEGCAHFGVATVEEARELRAAGIGERIYLLGGFFAEQAPEIVALDLTAAIFDLSLIEPLERAASVAGRAGFARPSGNRYRRDAARHPAGGFGASGRAAASRAVAQARRRVHAARQCRRSRRVRSPIGNCRLSRRARDAQSRGLRCCRCATSPIRPRWCCAPTPISRLMRPGLAMYGLPPVQAVREHVDLRPVMTFKTRVLQMKRVPAGSGVSYGHTFVAPRESVIGVLPVGYADGYRRGLQHGGEVLVRGRRAPVVGAVCMDLTMVDLTDVPDADGRRRSDLVGRRGEAMISVNDVARLAQTISYEMLCTVGRRVPRVYRR